MAIRYSFLFSIRLFERTHVQVDLQRLARWMQAATNSFLRAGHKTHLIFFFLSLPPVFSDCSDSLSDYLSAGLLLAGSPFGSCCSCFCVCAPEQRRAKAPFAHSRSSCCCCCWVLLKDERTGERDTFQWAREGGGKERKKERKSGCVFPPSMFSSSLLFRHSRSELSAVMSSQSSSLTSALLQFQKQQQQRHQLLQQHQHQLQHLQQQQRQHQEQQQPQSAVDLTNKMLTSALPMNYYYNLYTMQYYLKAKQELLSKGKAMGTVENTPIFILSKNIAQFKSLKIRQTTNFTKIKTVERRIVRF